MKYEIPENIKTVTDLEREVDKIYFDIDRGVVKMLVATVVANRMDFDAVWLMIVAPSSGGKTEMISMLNDISFIYGISDLTVNTFASGMKRTGKETSLLLKINNGIMTFKDFTSILSKNVEARKEIMKQLREIYDGEYVKQTGTGDGVIWKGKVGAIAGSTEAIYKFNEDLSIMGDRFIMYNMTQPNRRGMAERQIENVYDMHEKREYLKKCAEHLIETIIETMEDEEVHLSASMKEKIIDVADFATLARSGVVTDFKTGDVTFVPKPEMPTRMISQLVSLASGFIAMNKASKQGPKHPCHNGELTDDEEFLLFKTAFDSVPRTRRDALYQITKYMGGVTSAGLATQLNLPTRSVTKYLAHLNALGICTRHKNGGNQGDLWKLVPRHRGVVSMVENITPVVGMLESDRPEDFEDEDDFDNTDDWKKVDDPMAPR